MDAIAKIIHQTWKTDVVPEAWRGYVESWKTMHPGWEHRVWTDEANRAFVAEHYPDLLATFDAYPYAIQRADAIRYCLLHHYGGVYVDMDIECLRPIDELIDGRGFLAVLEPQGQASWLGRNRVVSNAFMASSPGHPFAAAAVAKMAGNPNRGVSHRDVLKITGPLMVSDVLESYRGDDVSLLPSEVAFPYTSDSVELHILRERMTGHEELKQRAIEMGAYAVHYWANTWVGALAGELVNPPPYRVEGFEFVPGLDSPGNDIVNLGRDIVRAAAACLEIEEAVGFNTDGFAKRLLLPRALWQPMGNGAPNEGLYVRKAPRKGIGKLLARWGR